MIIESLIGGIAYRIRGGLLDDLLGRELPNFWIRSVWALAVAIIIALKGYWLISPLIFGFALIGVLPGYWGGKFDLGNLANRNIKNYLWLTARGMFIMLLPAALMTIFGYYDVWYGVAAGALFVPCYLLGNVLYRFSKLQGHTQYGEFLLGAVIMAAI